MTSTAVVVSSSSVLPPVLSVLTVHASVNDVLTSALSASESGPPSGLFLSCSAEDPTNASVGPVGSQPRVSDPAPSPTGGSDSESQGGETVAPVDRETGQCILICCLGGRLYFFSFYGISVHVSFSFGTFLR